RYCHAPASFIRHDAACNLSARRNRVSRRYENRPLVDPQEPGAVFGELSALLNQPHTADVRTLEASEFRVAHADLLVEDPIVLFYVASIMSQRLNLAKEPLVELKGEASRHRALSA